MVLASGGQEDASAHRLSNELWAAAHIWSMKASTWTLAPARLGPASLDPRPVKNPNSPGFPTTVEAARVYAVQIKGDRARRVPWRKIAERMAISRIEAIRLAHSLDDVLEEIRAGEGQTGRAEAAHKQA